MDLPSVNTYDHYQDKAEHYSQSLRLLLGVNVDRPTVDRWRDLIALARGIDTYLDGGPWESLAGRTDDVRQLLDQPQEVGRQFPALAPETLGRENYRQLRQMGGAILQLNLEAKTADSLGPYIRARAAEGKLYGRLMISVATPAVAIQPGYQRFCRCFPQLGMASNLIDSIQDLHKDYAAGELRYRPRRLDRIRLVGHVVQLGTGPWRSVAVSGA